VPQIGTWRHERLGAVDGVDDPAEAGGTLGVAEFLAEEAVAGEVLGNQGADEFLGPPVGQCHRAVIGLADHLERGAILEGRIVNGLGEVAAAPRRFDRQVVPAAPFGIHAAPTFRTGVCGRADDS